MRTLKLTNIGMLLLYFQIQRNYQQLLCLRSMELIIFATICIDFVAFSYNQCKLKYMMRPRIVFPWCRRLFAFSSKKDHYQILQSTPSASQQQLKRQYYALVKRYHPDVSNANQQHIKAINQAYSILSDQKLRKKYDLEQGFNKKSIDIQENPLKGEEVSREEAPRRRRPYYDQQRQMYKSKRRYRYEGSSQKYLQDFLFGLAFTGILMLFISLNQKRHANIQQPRPRPFGKQDFQRQLQASLMRRPSQQ